MATKTTNYKLTQPAQSDYYNVNDFNNNMAIIDMIMKDNADCITNFPISKTETKFIGGISSSKITKGSGIIVAEKGHYSNGSALILVEASGSLKHHSLILAVSSSFNKKEKSISCLGNSAYATQLFSKASLETVWAADSHKVYLTLNTDIPTDDGATLKVTVISAEWKSCTKLLTTTEIANTKTITLTNGKTSFDVDTSGFLSKEGGTINGNLTAAAMTANDKLYSRALEVFARTSGDTGAYKHGGYIDFHYNSAINTSQTAGALNDYSTRLIEDSPGELNVMANSAYTPKLKVAGKYVYDESRITIQSTDINEGSTLAKGNIVMVYDE